MAAEKKYRWFRVFDTAEEMQNSIAPRRTRSLTVDGKKICIVHGLDGFYAVRDKCPHNGYPLSAGYCTDLNSIVCPIHRYHFDLKTGYAKSGIGARVETYPLEIRENGVFLGIEEYKWWPF
jgi:nitrite reductase/ring-hydroxylating ferredoxin subunit